MSAREIKWRKGKTPAAIAAEKAREEQLAVERALQAKEAVNNASNSDMVDAFKYAYEFQKAQVDTARPHESTFYEQTRRAARGYGITLPDYSKTADDILGSIQLKAQAGSQLGCPRCHRNRLEFTRQLRQRALAISLKCSTCGLITSMQLSESLLLVANHHYERCIQDAANHAVRAFENAGGEFWPELIQHPQTRDLNVRLSMTEFDSVKTKMLELEHLAETSYFTTNLTGFDKLEHSYFTTANLAGFDQALHKDVNLRITHDKTVSKGQQRDTDTILDYIRDAFHVCPYCLVEHRFCRNGDQCACTSGLCVFRRAYRDPMNIVSPVTGFPYPPGV